MASELASKTISGGEVICGAIVSETITCWIAESSLPAASDAVHVIDVRPNGNTSGASLCIESMPTWSVAVAVP